MKKHALDLPFLLVSGGLIFFGLIIFVSAALGLLARSSGASFTSVTTSQLLLGLVCGGIALLVTSTLDYRQYRVYTPYFFGFAIFLTILTFVPHIGLTLKGASRWISIGGISFQPEEVLKLATIMLLAAYYSANVKVVGTWRGGVLPLACIAGSASLLLLLQPNTDGALILGGTAAVMLFAAGGKIKHLAALALVGVLMLAIAAFSFQHVEDRLRSFVNHGSDPLGANWQVDQSLIAIGSGGVAGRGFGQSIEKFSYLPESTSDSVFAVAAEEFGFIGSVFLILLFMFFAIFAFRIATKAADPFGGLMVVGFTTLIVGQSLFNIGSSLGLVPILGLPLIFVSHGGSALAMALTEVGIILGVSRHMKT